MKDKDIKKSEELNNILEIKNFYKMGPDRCVSEYDRNFEIKKITDLINLI